MAAKQQKPAATKAVATWNDRLAKYAEDVASTEKSGGRFVSVRNGVLTFGGNAVPGNKMTVVVLDHIRENHLYTEKFTPESPVSPACFAFGRSDDDMAPHENSSQPQSNACLGCPANEWGSADQGKGKACKNIRRLSLITEDGMEDIDSAEIAYLKIPVTSVKFWAGYVQQLKNQLQRPPFAVVTEIGVVPDANSQFRITFELVQAIEDEAVLDALIKRREAGEEDLKFPYEPYQETAKPVGRGVKAPPGKAAPAKFGRR